MAAACALHELTRLQWNPTFSYTQRSHHASSLFFSKPQRKSKNFRLQIACKSKQSPSPVTTAQPDSDTAQIWKNSFDQVAIQIKETLNCALVSSGRRVGGRAFSSSSQVSLAIRRLVSWVGLLGSGRTILEDFNRLAESADTSTKKGLSDVLTEATLALLRHRGCCISGYKSVDVKRSPEDGEKRFNELSFEERGKFDEETLVNVNSRKRQSSKIPTACGFSSEYIVVTILVAAKGAHKLQPINGTGDLKEALKKLGLIPKNKIMAVELQWTPQNEKDTLSERELLEDYPLLKPL